MRHHILQGFFFVFFLLRAAPYRPAREVATGAAPFIPWALLAQTDA